jgi:hypothetical protein
MAPMVNGSPGTWTRLSQYSTTATYAWNTVSLTPGAYDIGVWVEDSTGASNALDASAGYTITAGCGNTTITAPGSPTSVAIGTSVTFTGSTTCGGTPQYAWWVAPMMNGSPGTWTRLSQYSTTPTYAWNTSAYASGRYMISDWIADSGGPSNAFDTSGAYQITLTGCASTSISASPSQADVLAGTTVTFTGSASGCPGTPQYSWWVAPMVNGGAGNWTRLTNYSATATYAWNTSTYAMGKYIIADWVEDTGGPAGAFDASAGYTLTVGCGNTTITAPGSPTSDPIGTSVTFTGSTTCGGTPQYAWWVATVTNGVPGNWQMVAGYSTGTTFTWSTTGLAAGNYMIADWIENSGGPSNAFDASTGYAITLH